MAKKTSALVLDDPSVSTSELRHFSGFPGLWGLDRPIAISELGFESEDAALARVEELNLPLAKTTVDHGEGLMPKQPNHLPSHEEALRTGWTPQPGEPGAVLTGDEVFPPHAYGVTDTDLAAAAELAPTGDEPTEVDA